MIKNAMTENTTIGNGSGRRRSYWRIAAWATAALILLLPLVAGADWTVGDFVFAAMLLFGSLGAYELAVRMTRNTAYRAGVGVAIVGAFLLVWVNAAVGITDSDADILFFTVVPTVGIIGAVIARFQPDGMARAMFATALVQALVAVVALIAGIVPAYNSAFEILGITGFFVVLFVGSAMLFREAARGKTDNSTLTDKLKVHTLLSALTVIVGASLVTYMMYVESEPGLIPLLLTVCGIGWYLITRVRLRSRGD